MNISHRPRPPIRKKRRGLAMLMVLMVLLTSTVTGVLAMQSTLVELRASGHARRAVQTRFLAEGVLSAALAFFETDPGFRMTQPQNSLFRPVPEEAPQSMIGAGRTFRATTLAHLNNPSGGVTGSPDVIEIGADSMTFDSSTIAAPQVLAFGPQSARFVQAVVMQNDQFQDTRERPGTNASTAAPIVDVYINQTVSAYVRLRPQNETTLGGYSARQGLSFHEQAANTRAYVTAGPFAN